MANNPVLRQYAPVGAITLEYPLGLCHFGSENHRVWFDSDPRIYS